MIGAVARLLITLIALFAVVPSLSSEELSKEFAFVFNAPHNPDTKQYSLYGRHSLKQNVNLLRNGTNRICRAVTTQHAESKEGISPFEYTRVRPNTRCESPSEYSLAFFGRVSRYQSANLTAISDSSFEKTVLDQVRSSGVLASLSQKAQNLLPGDEWNPLDRLHVKMYRFQTANLTGIFVFYASKEPNQRSDGPTVVVIKNKVFALTGWCSYPNFTAFALNDNFYFASGSFCCTCGISFRELFRISERTVQRIHVDGSGSD